MDALRLLEGALRNLGYVVSYHPEDSNGPAYCSFETAIEDVGSITCNVTTAGNDVAHIICKTSYTVASEALEWALQEFTNRHDIIGKLFTGDGGRIGWKHITLTGDSPATADSVVRAIERVLQWCRADMSKGKLFFLALGCHSTTEEAIIALLERNDENLMVGNA